MVLLRRVACAAAGDPLRQDTFVDATTIPQIGRFVRRVGRPRQDWTNQLWSIGAQKIGRARFYRMLQDQSAGADVRWKQMLDELF